MFGQYFIVTVIFLIFGQYSINVAIFFNVGQYYTDDAAAFFLMLGSIIQLQLFFDVGQVNIVYI